MKTYLWEWETPHYCRLVLAGFLTGLKLHRLTQEMSRQQMLYHRGVPSLFWMPAEGKGKKNKKKNS